MTRAWVIPVLMLAVAVVAFATNPVAFTHRTGPDVSSEALQRLKTQHSITQAGPRPQHLQVTEARMTGPAANHLEGRIIYRTLFGIRVGETLHDGNSSSTRVRLWRWAAAWLVFIIIEGALGLHLLRRLEI